MFNKITSVLNKATTCLEHSKAGKIAEKLYKQIKLLVSVQIATMRMKVGIKAVTEIHKYFSKKYLDPDYKMLRLYIVILERPVTNYKYTIKRKGWKLLLLKERRRVKKEERLFWVNFKNFKVIKKAGWLPRNMRIDELRNKAFYHSSLTRSYKEEYLARKHAVSKYTNYIKNK